MRLSSENPPNLAKLRLAHNITQSSLAAQTGLTIRTVAQWEARQRQGHKLSAQAALCVSLLAWRLARESEELDARAAALALNVP